VRKGKSGVSDKSVQVLLFLAQGFEDLEAVTILGVFGLTVNPIGFDEAHDKRIHQIACNF